MWSLCATLVVYFLPGRVAQFTSEQISKYESPPIHFAYFLVCSNDKRVCEMTRWWLSTPQPVFADCIAVRERKLMCQSIRTRAVDKDRKNGLTRISTYSDNLSSTFNAAITPSHFPYSGAQIRRINQIKRSNSKRYFACE